MNIHQHSKNKTSIHDLFKQMDERIPYEEFSTNMNKLNDEQKLIVEDNIY
jgi:hypothetical protein